MQAKDTSQETEECLDERNQLSVFTCCNPRMESSLLVPEHLDCNCDGLICGGTVPWYFKVEQLVAWSRPAAWEKTNGW